LTIRKRSVFYIKNIETFLKMNGLNVYQQFIPMYD